ncbi:MAG: hypothetical protein KJ674_00430 [Nanoarchaeota archaeon]|nr:hypothetical protein [Nanoarchaeota archaeon]
MKITLKKLEKIIRNCWDENTCHYKSHWNPKLPSTGHCRVTALLLQDFFKGNILYSYVKGNKKRDHYWNEFPNGNEVDITRDQFPKKVSFVKSIIITRKKAFSSKKTKKGYFILRRRVLNCLKKH